MKKLLSIPENADKLKEETSIEVLCAHVFNETDMVSFLNENGYKTVSSDSKEAADVSNFVYDKSTNMLLTPFLKPEEVLPLMQDLSQKFEQNKIGYGVFHPKYKDQFLAPKSENAPVTAPDEEVLKHLLRENLEKVNVNATWQDKLKENTLNGSPQKIYRGTAMGDAAHTSFSDTSRAFVYASPNILSASSYANMNTKSRFGFVEEYGASPNQKYSHDHGLESRQYNENIDWKNLNDVSYKASETFVLKETNPHLKTYLYDKQTGMMFCIYENGKYANKFFEEYAKSRRPQKDYHNENLSKRVENITKQKKSITEKQKTDIQKEGFLRRLFYKKPSQQTTEKKAEKNKEAGRKISFLRGMLPAHKNTVVQKTQLSQEMFFKKSQKTK